MIYYYIFNEDNTFEIFNSDNNITSSGVYNISLLDNDKFSLTMKTDYYNEKYQVYKNKKFLIIEGGCIEYCARKFEKIND